MPFLRLGICKHRSPALQRRTLEAPHFARRLRRPDLHSGGSPTFAESVPRRWPVGLLGALG
eukprot:5076387-Alexandrium_andersonii.AAC.1